MGQRRLAADEWVGNIVSIRHIFVFKPLVGIAILVCLGTILTLFKLNRHRPRNRSDQFLIAFLGLLTVYESLKLLKDAGVDMTSDEPLVLTMKAMTRVMDEMDTLLARRAR